SEIMSIRMCCFVFTALILGTVARAQTFHPASWEMTVDDQAPYGYPADPTRPVGPGNPMVPGAPLEFVHRQALSVEVDDLDGDGVKDIVLGGLGDGTYYVRVHYLQVQNGLWSEKVSQAETLDAGWTSACYSVAIGDVNGDGRPDIAVGRRLGGFCV